MKKTIDAVNEFKGVWPYGELPSMIESKGKQMSYSKGDLTSYFYQDALGLNLDMWSSLCSKEQFNQCVNECMTNDGDSVTYDEYVKELWANAPDDCVGIIQHKNSLMTYSYGIYVCNCSNFDGYKFCGRDLYPVLTAYDFTPRPQIKDIDIIKPAYTQEMFDNDELPSVGAKCYITYPDGNHDCEILGYHDDYVWFVGMGLCRTFWVDKCEFKPIPTPIKLEDGQAYQFDYNTEKNLLGRYEEGDFLINGIHHNSKLSTNIVKLVPDK